MLVCMYVCQPKIVKCWGFFYVFFPTVVRGLVKKIKRHFLGIFPNMGGEGWPESQNFCNFAKSFLDEISTLRSWRG